MDNYITKKEKQAHNPEAGGIQERVDLQHLARALLGNTGTPGGDATVYLIPAFNPDNPEYHIFKNYFRNPVTGDRGGAIKFVQKMRRLSYDQAIAFLVGWIVGREALGL